MPVDLTGVVDRNWLSQDLPYLRIIDGTTGEEVPVGQIRVEPIELDYSGQRGEVYKAVAFANIEGFDRYYGPIPDTNTDDTPPVDGFREPTTVEKLEQIADRLYTEDDDNNVVVRGEVITDYGN